MSDRLTTHYASLAPLNKDYLSFRDSPIPDWIVKNAPGAFQRLYVSDAENPHILVPTRRWEACGGDVCGIEGERE